MDRGFYSLHKPMTRVGEKHRMKPFLKWAGSKYRILDRILGQLPSGDRLIEPFAGSAALFLNTEYPAYWIADANRDIINLYEQIQLEGEAFIQYCRSFFCPENNAREAYLQYRVLFNVTGDARLKAALFLYLNRHGYNGLCRYNSRGKYNVPFGRYVTPYFPQEEMRFFAEKSRNAVFSCTDFENTMRQAVPGDVVYCDPPYVPLSVTASFTGYHTGGFDDSQQIRLRDLAMELAAKGIPVLISNHATPHTVELYASATITVFPVQRFISCNGGKRSMADEVLALFSNA